MTQFTVPTTQVYTDSLDGARYTYFQGDLVDNELAVRLGMAGATLPAEGSPFPTAEAEWLAANAVGEDASTGPVTEARTATAAPGGTTGVITDGTDFVVVTSDDANKVITLPAPTPGATVGLSNGATGYELRSSAPGTVAINGGTGTNAESAVPANTLVVCVCRTATAWLCSNANTAGAVTATEVATP